MYMIILETNPQFSKSLNGILSQQLTKNQNIKLAVAALCPGFPSVLFRGQARSNDAA